MGRSGLSVVAGLPTEPFPATVGLPESQGDLRSCMRLGQETGHNKVYMRLGQETGHNEL